MNGKEIIQILYGATSEDVIVVKQAEEQLKTLEINQGFYSLLLEISRSKAVDINIRWMASLYLKNGISKYWRQAGKFFLREEEKVVIREKLLECYDEETLQLATQNAVIVGKIARIDIRRWPQVIVKTLEVIKSDHDLHRNRALMILNEIVKELSSKRLITDRKVFHEISENIFTFLAQMNNWYMKELLTLDSSIQLKATLQMTILLSKILRRLVVYGATGYSADSAQLEYMKKCLYYLDVLLQSKSGPLFLQSCDSVEKLIVLYLKTLSEFQEFHSCSFLPLLENSLNFCLQQISNATNTIDFKGLIIYSGNLLFAIMKSYKKPNTLKAEINEITQTAIAIKDQILTEDCLRKLCNHIFVNYFPLTHEEVEEFDNAPEDYMLVGVGESYKFLLRPCIETLFVGLFYEYKNYVITYLSECLCKVNTISLENLHSNDVLYIAAIYKAVGLASYELFGDVDFNQLFSTRLIEILQINTKEFDILRQHVVWMIGEWINVKFSKENRVTLYGVLRHLLSHSNIKLVLKLASCKCLRLAIDDFDFVIEDFTPFLNDIFVGLCQLLVDVELCDSKMMVLNVVSIMVERIGNQVKSNASLLVQYLPKLWELSEEHNLLRGAVVNVLTHLVKALENDSQMMQSVTYPVILYSTAVEQPAHLYLLEDGLELWHTVVRFTPLMNDSLLALYRNIHILFERASEMLDVCLSITKAYLLTDAAAFLQGYGRGLGTVFKELMCSIKDESCSQIVHILTLAFQLQPELFVNYFQENIAVIITSILQDEKYPILMVNFLTCLAHIVIQRPTVFSTLCRHYCETNQCTQEILMERLLSVWLDKVDCMRLKDKKLSAIALTSMLPIKAKFIFERFGLILDFCVNVLYTLQKKSNDNEDDTGDDCFVIDPTTEEANENNAQCSENPSSKEKRLLVSDPVYTVKLLDFIRDKLNESKACYGDEHFAEAMETLDCVVASQLMSLIK